MDAAVPSSSAKFVVRRQSPELLRAEQPIPTHILCLSNLDDQARLRFHIPLLHFYSRNAGQDGHDPRQVIRDALTKLLVTYYPFAGRLRLAEDDKLCIDCTGEGVVFIAAESDAELADFGELPRPPFPMWEEFIHAPPGGSDAMTDAPILVVQVTLLRCGGFVVGTRVSHVMCDAAGLAQFLKALAQICRGEESRSISVDPPVWRRRTVLPPRNPPQVNNEALLQAFDQLDLQHGPAAPGDDEEEEECVAFTLSEVVALRKSFNGSTFELVSACLWRSRTRALYAASENDDEEEPVKFVFPVDVRHLVQPPLESGYYGNAMVWACAPATVGAVRRASLAEVAAWIRQAKNAVDEEYVRSFVDGIDMVGRASVGFDGMYWLSDIRYARFRDVDFGWGKGVYGGPAVLPQGPVPGPGSWLNDTADGCVLAQVCLPSKVMHIFRHEVSTVKAVALSSSL